MPDPIGAVVAIRDALSADVDLVILGGLAANAFRMEPRLTLDADILLVTEAFSARDLEDKLLAAGFRPPPGRRRYRAGRFEWRRLTWPRPKPIDPTVVDMFFSGADEHSAAFIRSVGRRAVPTIVGKRSVKAATPEDIIVFKALALASGVRGTKAVTDADDIRDILANHALKLDFEYVRAMASSIGVLRVVTRFLPKSRR